MIPVLFSIGPMKIYTLGIFLVLAFFWGSFLLWRLIRLTVYKEDEIFDCLFLSLAVGLFFARLFYVFQHFSLFGFDFLKFILINGYPGLSWPGGLFGGFLTSTFFLWLKKRDFKEIIDYFISPLLLAFSLGFLGLFFSQKNTFSFFLAVLILISGSFLSYRFLFLIRQKRLFKSFNLVFFLLMISLVGFLTEEGTWDLIFFILFLTSGGHILYYFRIVIFKSLKGLAGNIIHYGKKFFSRGIKGNKK